MKAIEYKTYGSAEVFQLSEVARPVPKAKEVMICVHASTVTAADIMMREGKPVIGRLYLGISKPKRTILGFEFAGKVIAIGNDVSMFKIGDKVFGGTTKLGAYAEYVCVDESDVITTMPSNLSYNEAAPVNGSAITVMNFLVGLGKISEGNKVLINGASGALGTYAIQVAKFYGAEVTAVCSTSNVALVQSLGADKVIDYTKMDFTANGLHYDIIFDAVGKRTFAQCKKSLIEKGVYLSTVVSFPLLLSAVFTNIFGGRKAKTSSTGMLPVKVRLNYFITLKELLQSGKIKTVIDKCYTLKQMSAAHTYVEQGHKKGNVVITI